MTGLYRERILFCAYDRSIQGEADHLGNDGCIQGESPLLRNEGRIQGDHDMMAKTGVYRERLMARRNWCIQGELSLDMDPVYKERRITLAVTGVYRGREARSHMYTGELAQASGSTCIHGVMEI